ncbi:MULTISPECIES: shikimate dehydrogenase [unclassified Paenibacillus]|uniref:shikimate dehydrogenase n=1 Tax=unclassified Paenibacillus TaxID=185978 RepID=UPI0003E1C978|nr:MULTISPECIES: shikimate dehydrogenase [unclassified Paenibacillus]ETT44477.1 shikimate 5-dehydrogenase [Paenibacillus sp. FSL R7-269]OMF98580.1 shikimate dehydrogenase [Paenibacillus sp. FSL R7-0337]
MTETGRNTQSHGELLLGVMGDPIAQSKSPLMHGAALQALGLSGAYVPLHITPDKLGDAVQAIRTLGFRGVNVTIPHKVAVMQYLDRLDSSAVDVGAVNTIVNDNGILTGFNTDGIGYVRSLMTEAVPDLTGTRILVIGAGGAARGIVSALLKEQPASVLIVNRNEERARQLADSFSSRGSLTGAGMDAVPGVLGSMDIVINTTSVGMYPHMEDMPIDPSGLHEGMIVSDLIYNPLHTRLLTESLKRGCSVHGGLGMFVYQGAYALEYWTGLEAPAAIMRQTIADCLGQVPGK